MVLLTGAGDMPSDLQVHGLQVKYGRSCALDIESWTVPVGRTALLGLNGSGKSTLMRCLAGLQLPTSGEVKSSVQPSVGYLPQEFGFPGNFRLREMLEYVGWLRGLSSSAARSRATAVAQLAGLTDLLSQQLSTLSGGTVQRAAIAQATVHEPELLILDEPTVGLDVVNREAINSYLDSLRGIERIVFSTHQLQDVAQLADQVAILHSGRLVYQASTETFLIGQGGTERSVEGALLQVLADQTVGP